MEPSFRIKSIQFRRSAPSGFTLVEVAVALAILSLTMIGVALLFNTSTNSSKTHMMAGNACRNHVNNVLNRIKDKGTLIGAATHIPDTVNNPSTKLGGGSCPDNVRCPPDLGIDNNQRWDATIDLISADDPPVIQPHLQLLGTMNSLLALYRANPAHCSSAKGVQYANSHYFVQYDPQIIVDDISSDNLNNLQTWIRIQPYNVISGDLEGCPSDLEIRPESMNEEALTAADGTLFQMPPGIRSDIGFLVTVHADYEDQADNPTFCEVESRFQYQMIKWDPDNLSVSASSVNSNPFIAAGPTALDCSAPPTPDLTATIEHTVQITGLSGKVLLCRDRSVRRTVVEKDPMGSPGPSINLPAGTFRNLGRSLIYLNDDTSTFTGPTIEIINPGNYQCFDDIGRGISCPGFPPYPGGGLTGDFGLEEYVAQGAIEPTPFIPEDDPAAGEWISCHLLDSSPQIRECLLPAPDGRVTTEFNISGIAMTYTFTFTGVKHGCDILVDVVDVDGAFGVGGVVTTPIPSNPFYTITEYTSEPLVNITACWDGANSIGYFQCGACPP